MHRNDQGRRDNLIVAHAPRSPLRQSPTYAAKRASRLGSAAPQRENCGSLLTISWAALPACERRQVRVTQIEPGSLGINAQRAVPLGRPAADRFHQSLNAVGQCEDGEMLFTCKYIPLPYRSKSRFLQLGTSAVRAAAWLRLRLKAGSGHKLTAVVPANRL